MALFNKTAKQWRDENKDLKGNIRDYASLNELLVLSNMKSYNVIMIELEKLNDISVTKLENLNLKNP